jgi:hypothetical protein
MTEADPFLTTTCKFLFGSIFGDVSQSGDGWKKDLARFGYKPKNESKKSLKHRSIFLAILIEPSMKLWRFSS